jgi:hypothetical protein
MGSIKIERPAGQFRPGAIREFQFREYTDFDTKSRAPASAICRAPGKA